VVAMITDTSVILKDVLKEILKAEEILLNKP